MVGPIGGINASLGLCENRCNHPRNQGFGFASVTSVLAGAGAGGAGGGGAGGGGAGGGGAGVSLGLGVASVSQ